MNANRHVQPSPDPLIDEIRAIRREISERFNNDVDRLCDYLREQEQKHPERMTEPTPNRRRTTAT